MTDKRGPLGAKGFSPMNVVVTKKNDGTITMTPAQANVWQDVESAGSVAARPLDLVLAGVKAGDWIEGKVLLLSPTATASYALDLFTIVDGAPVNQFGSNGNPPTPWVLSANAATVVSAAVAYQLQAGDVVDGNVRLRLRFRAAATTPTRNLAGTVGNEIRLEARGPLG